MHTVAHEIMRNIIVLVLGISAASCACANVIEQKSLAPSPQASNGILAAVGPNAGPSVAAEVTKPAPAPAPTPTELSRQPATTGDVLEQTRLVLELSREHSQRSLDYFHYLLYGLGGIAGLLGFFGFRQLEALVKPYKDKLSSMEKKHEEAMQKQIADFEKRSQLNARAMVVSSTIWEYISECGKLDGTELTEKLTEVIKLVEFAIPDGDADKVDPFLSGVLLIRKAYAQKRLGDYEGAYQSAAQALALNLQTSKTFWHYNAACYASLAGRLADCCTHLRRAIMENPEAREDAATDPDFEGVRGEAMFTTIVVLQQ